MGILSQYVKSEADQLRKELQLRADAIKEWTESLDQLYLQIQQWISEADGGHGLLSVGLARSVRIQEPRLGEYEVVGRTINLGTRQAVLVPRARHVVASIRPPGFKEPRRADGMVELREGSNASGGTAEYYLFRLKDEDGDKWFIRSVALWNADREYGTVEPLDRDRFEAAILSVLK